MFTLAAALLFTLFQASLLHTQPVHKPQVPQAQVCWPVTVALLDPLLCCILLALSPSCKQNVWMFGFCN